MFMKSFVYLIVFASAINIAFAQSQPNKKTPESTEVWDPAVRVITP
jgi:hypothetical protein